MSDPRPLGAQSLKNHRDVPPLALYGLAVAAVAAATLLTLALRGAVGAQAIRVTFAFFYLAVFLVAHYAGRGPGLAAVLLSALAGNHFFLQPDDALSLAPPGLIQTAVFAFVSLLVVHLSDRSRAAKASARQSRDSLETTLRSIGDAVIATDDAGRVRFMNPVAERLTGWPLAEAAGRPLTEVFKVVNELTRREAESMAEKVMREGRVVGLANHTVLVARGGREVPVEDSGAPITDERGRTTGVVLVFHDVSERRKAEWTRAELSRQVERERGRLKNLLRSVPGVVWEAWGEPDEASQRINFVSEHVEQMLGYTVEEWLSTPNFWLSIVHPEDRGRAAAEARAIFEGGGDGVSQFRWVRRDGRVIHVEAQSRVIPDEAGRPAGMRGVTMDISARKAAEEALRASRARLEGIVDSAMDAIISVGPDQRVLLFNHAAEKMFRCRAAEALGRPLDRFIPERFRAEHHQHVESFGRTGVTTRAMAGARDVAAARSDGEEFPVEASISQVEAGGQKLYTVIMRDVTERRASEGRLRFLAEASRVLGSSLDYETTLKGLARLAVSALADYCLIDLVDDDGQARRVAVAHADPARQPLVERLRALPPGPQSAGVPRVLRTGQPEVINEVNDEVISSLARDGEHARVLRELGLRSFVTVPLAARGRTIGALTFSSTRAALRYSAEDVAYAQEIAARAALAIENARLYGRAQEVNRAKDEFLATLSHELRTPLTPILGWTHMIRSGRLGAAEVAQGVRVIEKNSQSLSRLINDLLDMSSILSGKMRVESAPVDLSSVVREAVETVRPQAAARSVSLEVLDGDPEAPVVSGDRTRLVQVCWNLLHNAVKFSPEGGRVRVRVHSRGGAARVEIEDEGAGIAPEFLPYVFERFRQADGSTTRQHGGLGLGLALVKSFVEAHGGTVTAESAGEGRGSRFTVALPAAEERGARRPSGDLAPGGVEPCPEETCHVLVVEDAPDTLDMLKVVFESRGYRTAACATPEEALRVAESGRFDIIVSDIGLPRIDGYELIARLRDFPHLRRVPALALTGYAAQRDAEAALAAGFDAHVPKPVDPSELAERMEQLMRREAAGAPEE